jgi:hypothetical protein
MSGALEIWAGPVCAVRIGLGALFLRAAFLHAREFRGFADIVGGYRMLPERASLTAAGALVVAEIGAGLAMLAAVAVPGMAVASGVAAGLLLGLFALAMAINLLRGRRILCGCGDESAPLSWAGFAQTAVLVPIALAGALPVGAPQPILLVQAVGTGVLLLMLHDALRRLWQARPGRAG